MERTPDQRTGEEPGVTPAAESVVERVVEEAVHRSAGAGQAALPETVRPVVEELLGALADTATPAADLDLPAAFAFGRALAGRPAGAPDLAREVLQLARALERTLQDRGALEPAAGARLREVADRALVHALEGHAAFQVERRDAWLSYYSHEMRNRLNTLVNAVWLLKNSEQGPAQIQRICEIAERASRRLEDLVKEARGLEERFQREPPARPGKK